MFYDYYEAKNKDAIFHNLEIRRRSAIKMNQNSFSQVNNPVPLGTEP